MKHLRHRVRCCFDQLNPLMILLEHICGEGSSIQNIVGYVASWQQEDTVYIGKSVFLFLYLNLACFRLLSSYKSSTAMQLGTAGSLLSLLKTFGSFELGLIQIYAG